MRTLSIFKNTTITERDDAAIPRQSFFNFTNNSDFLSAGREQSDADLHRRAQAALAIPNNATFGKLFERQRNRTANSSSDSSSTSEATCLKPVHSILFSLLILAGLAQASGGSPRAAPSGVFPTGPSLFS